MGTGRPADDEVLQEVVMLEVAVKQVYGDNPDEDYYEERVTAEYARVYNPPLETPASQPKLRPTTRRALPPAPGLRTGRPAGEAAGGQRPGGGPAPLIVDATEVPAERAMPADADRGRDPVTGSSRFTTTSGGGARPAPEPRGAGRPLRTDGQSEARPGAHRDDQPLDLTTPLSKFDYSAAPSAGSTRQFPRSSEPSRSAGRPAPSRPPEQRLESTSGRSAPGSSAATPSAASPSARAGLHGAASGGSALRPDDLSYTERIPVRDLLPAPEVVPGRGWRRLLYQATFGSINLGRSPDELYEEELQAAVRSRLRGPYAIGVLGKGGVGKTTVAACVGSVFAELRKNDPLVAIDADTSFGKLGSRVDPKAHGSYWELNAADQLDTFADMRGRLGINAAGLFVLANESDPARRRALDPAVYREAVQRLGRFFPLQIVDCGAAVDSPVTQEVVSHLDALVVVSSPWVDGAAAAGQILDWLATRELTNLLQRTVIVLNDSDGHASRRMKSILAKQFRGGGHVVIEVPYDRRLRPGGAIAGTCDMSAKSRRRFLEVAAELADQFGSRETRSRDAR